MADSATDPAQLDFVLSPDTSGIRVHRRPEYDLYARRVDARLPLVVFVHGPVPVAGTRPREWPVYRGYASLAVNAGIAAAIVDLDYTDVRSLDAPTAQLERLANEARTEDAVADNRVAIWAFPVVRDRAKTTSQLQLTPNSIPAIRPRRTLLPIRASVSDDRPRQAAAPSVKASEPIAGRCPSRPPNPGSRAIIAVFDTPATAAVLAGEGHAPVGAVLLADVLRQMSPSPAPKGHGPPRPCAFFPCTRAVFRGPPEGAMIAVLDPRQADAAVVAKGHAPVVAVLVPAVNRIASEHHDCRHAGQRPEGS